MRHRAAFPALLAFAACLLHENPAFDRGTGDGSGDESSAGSSETGEPPGCEGDRVAFAVVTDHPEGQDASLDRVLAEIIGDHPDVRFVLGAGDMPTFESVYARIVVAPWPERCGATTLPYFPGIGHDEAGDPAALDWLAMYVATNWMTAPETSPLAQQLPGLANFRRGPLGVQRDDGVHALPAGSVYSFDYAGMHFALVNAYEPGVTSDATAGIFDSTPGFDDIGLSQLDWLRDDLASTAGAPTFVVGHVPLAFICYADPVQCPEIPAPPGVSEHNGAFNTAELTAALVDAGVTAWFHGHDEVASRLLVDGMREVAYRRAYWEVVDEPTPDPAAWEALQGPGRIWQVDAGRIDDSSGSYVIVTVEGGVVRFEIHAYADTMNSGATMLWDAWEIAP